jgi:hypothetical protein
MTRRTLVKRDAQGYVDLDVGGHLELNGAKIAAAPWALLRRFMPQTVFYIFITVYFFHPTLISI